MKKYLAQKTIFLDLAVLIAITISAYKLTMNFELRPLASMFLFFIVPTFYLIVRARFGSAKVCLTKVVALALSLGYVGGVIDATITASKGWWIPDAMLVFPIRFLGIWNIDNTLWYIFLIAYVVTFYEYFLDEGGRKIHAFSKRVSVLIFLPLCVSILFFGVAVYNFSVLEQIPYAYLTCSLPLLIFPLLMLIWYGRNIKRLLGKFLIVCSYFAFVNILHEISALRLGQWLFEGEYIGSVFFAGVSIPLEEFLFYVLFSAFFILAYYEIFDDDAK